MKTIDIYAVVSSKGGYDDYHEYVERCFTNMDDAVEYAHNVDESHKYVSNIPQDVIDDIDKHFYTDYYNPEMNKFCKENNIPNGNYSNNLTQEQSTQIWICDDKLHECYDDWCIKYLLEKYPQYTENDYKSYLDYLDHAYDDWHDCIIKTFQLDIANDFV